jgi:hypothetical protein
MELHNMRKSTRVLVTLQRVAGMKRSASSSGSHQILAASDSIGVDSSAHMHSSTGTPETHTSRHADKKRSPRIMDYIACLDVDVCRRYIWSHVPSYTVAMILAIRGDLSGGISYDLDFKEWMLTCLKVHVPSDQSSHIIDLNLLVREIFKCSMKKDMDINKAFMASVLERCTSIGLMFNVTVGQCSNCCEVSLRASFSARHCTRMLPTCMDVAKQISNAVTQLPCANLGLFNVCVDGVDIGSEHGRNILTALCAILQKSRCIHKLDVVNIHHIIGSDQIVRDMLTGCRNVHSVTFRNIAMCMPSVAQAVPRGVASAKFMGVNCMDIDWMYCILPDRELCNIRSLTLSRNVLPPGTLFRFVDMLGNCSMLEELHFTGCRQSTHSANWGLWVLTAMSSRVHEDSSTMYAKLRVVTIDISKPALQVCHDYSNFGLDVMYDDMWLGTWHDVYPDELLQFQSLNSLPAGGDLSCMVDSVMPCLESIHIRTSDDLSILQGLQIAQDVCKHRRVHGSSRMLENLYIYSSLGHHSLMYPGKRLYNALGTTFKNVYMRPLSSFPFF